MDDREAPVRVGKWDRMIKREIRKVRVAISGGRVEVGRGFNGERQMHSKG